MSFLFGNKDKEPKQPKPKPQRVLTRYVGGGVTTKEKTVLATIKDNKFIYDDVNSISLDSIVGVSIKTEEQIHQHMKSRLSVTRMALLGPLALAAPKRKVKTNKTVTTYLTVDYVDGVMNGSLLFSGNGIHNLANMLNNVIHARSKSVVADEANTVDPIEEVKRFKELLDLGIISQEEYDTKRKELLKL